MNIYIGKDYDDKPLCVLLADDKEKANIAMLGMKLYPHSVEEIDPSQKCGSHGVAFLLTSDEQFLDRSSEVRVWKRGL